MIFYGVKFLGLNVKQRNSRDQILSTESSRTNGHVSVSRYSDVSGTDSVPIFRVHLKMGTEAVPATSEELHMSKRLSAQQDIECVNNQRDAQFL